MIRIIKREGEEERMKINNVLDAIKKNAFAAIIAINTKNMINIIRKTEIILEIPPDHLL